MSRKNKVHPIDEWDALEQARCNSEYNNKDNFRFTRCTATVIGHANNRMRLIRTKAGVTVKFSGFKQDKYGENLFDQFVWIHTRLSHGEAQLLAEWLTGILAIPVDHG